MNRLEEEWAGELRAKLHAGEIAAFWFEEWKWKLADKTFYTPDFVVQMNDGELEVHEVKGFWEDDARVKVKVFADKFPFRVRCLRKKLKREGGGWLEEDLTKGGSNEREG